LANSTYLANRKKYTRPQAIIWLDASTDLGNINITGTEYEDFLILSDHNRSEMSFTTQRIETRQRMINGTMRSYHVADKLQISWSWNNLPSRSFNKSPEFNSLGQISASGSVPIDYTVDNGAGGRELLDWYENHPGAFYMMLAYDKYNSIPGYDQYNQLSMYNQIIPVYFASFEYNVVKRGATNHDLWNVSVQLEEA
jgi:hypothetical protein